MHVIAYCLPSTVIGGRVERDTVPALKEAQSIGVERSVTWLLQSGWQIHALARRHVKEGHARSLALASLLSRRFLQLSLPNFLVHFFSENQAPLSFLASNTVVLFYTSLFQPHLSAFICHSSICQRNLLSSLTTSTIVIFFYFNLSSPVRIDVDNLGTLWTELQSYSPISSNPLSPTHLLNL